MTRWQTCFLLASLLCTEAHANDLSRIRTDHPVIAAALAEGEERSSTFARLLARLRRSDLIVHVLPAEGLGPLDGALQFVASVGNVRYVRIRVRLYQRSSALIMLLAHELMHAVEIADTPEVRDNKSLKVLYSRIGYYVNTRRADAFDSAMAVDAGRQVLGELQVGATK
jgi:hypothetical protein